jgi:pyridoxine 5-phosphate synthase
MPHLGVNIDHVATLRQARRGVEPDPVWAAVEAELGGAACITLHLREDRRHIQDRDLEILKKTVQVKLNLEMAVTDPMVDIACRIRPNQATLVPEGRQEITTEGGLPVAGQEKKVKAAVTRLKSAGIAVSLFIDPEPEANAPDGPQRDRQFLRIAEAARQAQGLGLVVHAGHGLNYVNVGRIAQIPGMTELNIGHSIVSRAIFIGLRKAVREMARLIESPST